MESKDSISIWFFIGVSLLVNGILIFGAGVYEFAHPPELPVVLFRLHASVWWGALLSILGASYCYRYLPRRGRAEK
ncbi:MAG TPA: hypothetical protein VJN90_11175 [Candidatus Acidoferrales bacterium]|nr:hypothetical protein [Candidatus Acidoferrales bacterium]